jgi:hypothetical protein
MHSVDGVELKPNTGKKAKPVGEKIIENILNYSVRSQSYLAVVVKWYLFSPVSMS